MGVLAGNVGVGALAGVTTFESAMGASALRGVVVAAGETCWVCGPLAGTPGDCRGVVGAAGAAGIGDNMIGTAVGTCAVLGMLDAGAVEVAHAAEGALGAAGAALTGTI